MDKDVVHIYNRMLLSHKKDEIIPSAVTWMDLEIAILYKVREREFHMVSHIYVIFKKKGGYKLTYLQNRNSLRCRKQTYSYQGGKRKEG